MVEYSLSLWKKGFGDIVSLLEKAKKKYEEQHPAVPKNYIETLKGGKIQTDSAEIYTAHSRLHSLIYAAQTLLCPKGFHYLPNLSGLKRIQENALDLSNLNKRSSHRNRDLKEALRHYIVQNMAHLRYPKHTKGSGVIGNAIQKRHLGAAKW